MEGPAVCQCRIGATAIVRPQTTERKKEAHHWSLHLRRRPNKNGVLGYCHKYRVGEDGRLELGQHPTEAALSGNVDPRILSGHWDA